MSIRRLLPSVLALGVLLGATPTPAESQLGDLRRRAQRAVVDEVGDAMERGLRNAVRCSLDDEACAERARSEGKTPVFVGADGEVLTDEDGNPITNADDARAATEGPDGSVWTNYDFVPGNRVVFALDLADARVGRFPARQLEYVSGTAEVVERDGVRLLQFTSATTFRIRLDAVLADHYTLELTHQASRRNAWLYITNGEQPGNMGGYEYDYLTLSGVSGIYRNRQPVSTGSTELIDDEMLPFKLQVDRDLEMETPNADYAILYAGSNRIGQVPTANFERNDFIEFHVVANSDYPAYLGELVVAVHGDPLHEALTTGERVFTTRGILFDHDSDRLRGESAPTLSEILRALARHDDLSLEIEGHTDSSGEDAYNLELSERRARAVVEYLIENGIDGDRLSAVGRGETEPVANNDSEAGRQQNRRVVIRNTGAR